MTMEATTTDLCARLKLPLQNLSSLSFCPSKPSGVKAWAESLPATRVGHTSVLLYKVLPEFSRLKIAPEKRLEMLETLRPVVQQCIEGLSKDFLNQPLLLSDAAIKAATVAQALQKHLSNAYTVCVRDFYYAKKLKEPLLLQSLHRACSGLGLMLMRSYQLYTPIRGQIWHELYCFYLIAEQLELLKVTVPDSMLKTTRASTVAEVCIRSLLLACVRPNQLRQQEVAAVYYALESWAGKSRLVECGEIEADNLHIVCLDLDMPPLYRTRYKGALDDSVRELDNHKLLAQLKDLQAHATDLPLQITPVLLNQLIQAWDLPSLRTFERLPLHSELEICVGIGSICQHLDHTEGDGALSKSNFDATNISCEQDIWSESFDSGDHVMGGHKDYILTPETPQTKRKVQELQSFTVNTLDTSPGGYCLNWREEMPAQARVGEVVGVKDPKRTKWNIAVIRWVRQSGRGTQMGLQLLAPMAESIEVAMIHKVGDDSRYMHGLLLPALRAASQDTSLLTPSMPFKEHCKVHLKRKGQVSKLQLSRKLFATGSINQFNYRELEIDTDSSGADDASDSAADSFDESW